MQLELNEEQQRFQQEMRAYFTKVAEEIGGSDEPEGGSRYKDYIARLGDDGMLGIGWPVEYGGQGRSPLEQFIWFDEAERAYAPTLLVTLNTVGPTLMRFGT